MTQQAKRGLANDIESLLAVETIIDDIIQLVQENCKPEDVFSVKTLKTWAENNGYKEED